MFKMLKLFIGFFYSLSLMAQDGLVLGEPTFNGTGCPLDSVATVLSPDNQTLSVLFSSFVAEAGKVSTPSGAVVKKLVDRKNCNLGVPVLVPHGYAISIVSVDYRGYNHIPYGGRGLLTAQYFFGGQKGPTLSKSFAGGTDSEYIFSNQLGVESLVWSACGANTTLRINASILAQSNSYYQQALSTVDSADISSGIVYHIQWRTCGDDGGGFHF